MDGWLMHREGTESEEKMVKDDTRPLSKLPIEHICIRFFFLVWVRPYLGFLQRAAMSDFPRCLAYERATPGILRVGM